MSLSPYEKDRMKLALVLELEESCQRRCGKGFLCTNCKIETKKHCDDCGGYGGYGSDSDSDSEVEVDGFEHKLSDGTDVLKGLDGFIYDPESFKRIGTLNEEDNTLVKVEDGEKFD
jgi:hypothetical protein